MKTNLMGHFSGMSNEEYHGMTLYLSSTGLREFQKSPAHYQAYITAKREPTAAMFFGTNFHELIGEPMLFGKKYTKGLDKADYPKALFTATELTDMCKKLGLKPGKNMTENTALILAADPSVQIWSDLVAKHAAANEGKTVLSAEDFDRLDGMLYSMVKSKTALHLFTGGVAEQSVFWKDPKSGVLCRCRPDYLRTDGIIVDLKTTEDASPRGFKKAVRNYQYDLASAFYLRGVSHVLGEPLNEYVHVAVEKKAPHGIGMYTLSDGALLRADQEIERLLELFAECQAKNEWPSYPDSIQNLDPSEY